MSLFHSSFYWLLWREINILSNISTFDEPANEQVTQLNRLSNQVNPYRTDR